MVLSLLVPWCRPSSSSPNVSLSLWSCSCWAPDAGLPLVLYLSLYLYGPVHCWSFTCSIQCRPSSSSPNLSLSVWSCPCWSPTSYIICRPSSSPLSFSLSISIVPSLLVPCQLHKMQAFANLFPTSSSFCYAKYIGGYWGWCTALKEEHPTVMQFPILRKHNFCHNERS
jgi:hypothetical protein